MSEENKIAVAGCCYCPKCGAELQIEVKLPEREVYLNRTVIAYLSKAPDDKIFHIFFTYFY